MSRLTVPGPYGRFYLVERLGVGGMAEVYRAHQGSGPDEHSLVVKRLRPRFHRSQAALRLFQEEARLTASIHHENIVEVFGLERLPDGEVFITMEHVDGSDLRWLLTMARRRRRRLPVWLSVHAVSQVLGALQFLSELKGPSDIERNVVHCDVTPENVFISSTGIVKLGDFGVAVEDARPEDFHLGQLRGKLPYCSPEQARGERLDGRSDVYSAAAMLWECLTGRPLITERDPQRALRAILAPDRPRPSSINPEVPSALDDILLAALAPERARRTPSAGVLRNRLVKLLHGLVGPVGPELVVAGMSEALAPRQGGGARAAAPSTTDWVSTDGMLFTSPPEPDPTPAPDLALPTEPAPFATFLHFDGSAFGPTALHESLSRLQERSLIDLDAWGLSVLRTDPKPVQDVLRILGIDMLAAERDGTVAFEVSLTTQALPSLFGQLGQTLSSGTLVLERDSTNGRDERHVRIADGRLADVWSPLSTFRLWGALTRPSHAEGAGFAAAVHRALADGSAVADLLSPALQDELRQARLFEIHRQLEEIFGWDWGRARFVPGVIPGASGAPTLAQLVPEIVLQTHDESRLMRVLEPHLTHRVIAARDVRSEMTALGLLDIERLVVDTVLAAATLAEGLMTVADEGRAIAGATIYSLHAIGLLRFV